MARKITRLIVLLPLLAGCATLQPQAPLSNPVAATVAPEAPVPQPLESVPAEHAPQPVSFKVPGLPPEPAEKCSDCNSPEKVIAYANERAVRPPDLDRYYNATQRWKYEAGAVYQVYLRPGRMTSILLGLDEVLQHYPVADADEERWKMQHFSRGDEGQAQEIIAVVPERWGMVNNMLISTSRRTYALELITPDKPRPKAPDRNAYMVQVAWSYPDVERARQQAELAQLQVRREEKAADAISLNEMSYPYHVDPGKKPPLWTPQTVFVHRSKVHICFPSLLHEVEAPVLFVSTTGDKADQVVNYRRRGGCYVVDRLFEAAELRVGNGKGQQVVRISREGQ